MSLGVVLHIAVKGHHDVSCKTHAVRGEGEGMHNRD